MTTMTTPDPPEDTTAPDPFCSSCNMKGKSDPCPDCWPAKPYESAFDASPPLEAFDTAPEVEDAFTRAAKEELDKEQRFRSELEHLINRHSREIVSDTPDFILAEFLRASLAAFDAAIIRRADWYSETPEAPQP